jgi:hypothetical protein
MRSAPVLDTDKTPEFDGGVNAAHAPVGIVRRVGGFLLRELREMLPPTIFFFIGFNLIILTTNLLLADYGEAVASFVLATGAALVVGKAVLVANATRSIRHFDRAPLMRPILYKSVFYWAVVFIARLLEHWIRFWLVEHHPLGTFLPHMVATFDWHRFIAIQLWIFVLFLIYETITELNHLFGEGELWHLLATSRPAELPLNRRQRILELVRLSKLADAHSIDEFHDPTSPAHAQLVDVMRRIAAKPRARPLVE